jgi:hypothetical protein
MKSLYFAALASLSCGSGFSQEVISYLNYIRQFQTPSGVAYDASNAVANSGSMLSPLPIEKNGARFQLWTFKSSSLSGITEYLLGSSYVASYIPTAILTVYSDDTTSIVPRTQVGRNFYVRLVCDGLLKGATDPEASKSVNFQHHVQSYGVGGDGVNIDRTQATIFKEISITENGTQNLTYTFTAIPGAVPAKIRGEERFTIRSLPDERDDYRVESLIIDSSYIQIWPVSDGSISGLADNQVVRYSAPQLTITMNDLYPSSTTYAQVYKGAPQLGVEGTILPGSSLIINDSVPNSRVLILKGYEEAFTEDGVWTMELLTKTPFGTDRLDYVSFTLDRTMKIKNTSINTIE